MTRKKTIENRKKSVAVADILRCAADIAEEEGLVC